MTFLELINDVLIRLRENEVASVDQTNYIKLIGKYVNDGKRAVEDAYNWNALSSTYTINTTANVFNYTLTGSGTRFRVLDAFNDTKDSRLNVEQTTRMNELFYTQASTGSPTRYNFNGVNNSGDTQVDIYPIPDGVYTLKFNLIKPQATLSAATDRLLVPSEPVIFYALSKAIIERGEDAGISSGEAYQFYQQSLADHISNESNLYPEDSIWVSY
jgi:hypothetical protein